MVEEDFVVRRGCEKDMVNRQGLIVLSLVECDVISFRT